MHRPVDTPAARAGAPLPLRVGFLGELGRGWLGDWVDPVDLTGGRLDALDPTGGRPHDVNPTGDGPAHEAEGSLDTVVLDPAPPGVGRIEAERLVADARAAGASVIGFAPGGTGPAAASEPIWAGLEDLALGGGATDAPPSWAVQPVDLRVFNPLGYRHTDVAGFGCVATSRSVRLEAASTFLARAAHQEPVTLFAPQPAGLGPAPPGVLVTGHPRDGLPRLAATLKERLGGLDHPSLHASEAERAAALVRLCASGVPVCAAELSDPLLAMLGEELAGALRDVTVADLLDLDRRERVSIAQRRAALRNHSLDARWRALCGALSIAVPARPKVSVILSTRRQEWLAFGVAQVARQSYEPRELVVCLHGDEFTDDVDERLRAEVEGPLEVVHVASELTLGDALNQGVEIASGEFVTKMDDDDYYSVDHLWDLVLASEYSGADLVGKAAEFVYLEDIGLTLRRFMGDTEGASHPRLAGGGMMARRDSLREIGGWPSQSRGEDTVLIKTFRQSRRRVHRTHGYGYILNRHGRDHTWNTYVDYFLIQSEREWRGLRFDRTGIED